MFELDKKLIKSISIHILQDPMAYMTRAKTKLGVQPAPVIASFSSRGPNPIQPIILKVHSLLISPTLPLVCSNTP